MKKILIVEDTEQILKNIRQGLNKIKIPFETHWAGTHEEAYSNLDKNYYNIISISGEYRGKFEDPNELARQIKERWLNTYVIGFELSLAGFDENYFDKLIAIPDYKSYVNVIKEQLKR